MDIQKYKQAASSIIQEQQLVMGPIAYDLARSVPGLEISDSNTITITHSVPKELLGDLVAQYRNLFGEISVRVSRKALKNLSFETNELPEILQ